MKKRLNVLLIVGTALLTLACSKTKSYTDMLKDQEKAIDRLIDREHFTVREDYPVDGVFAENEFVLLDNGVYLNVIDPGSEKRAEAGKTQILYRCIAFYPMDSTYLAMSNSSGYPLSVYSWGYGYIENYRAINYGPHSNNTQPYPFTYGTYTTPFVSEGLQTPLEYVGDGAKVKLIVPFKRGLSNDNQNGQPIYYEILQYDFIN